MRLNRLGFQSFSRQSISSSSLNEYGVPIYEDECYADLVWSGERPPSLWALDDEGMVHDTLQQREQTPREFTSAMRQGVPLVLESKGDLVPWKYYAEVIPVKYTGRRAES